MTPAAIYHDTYRGPRWRYGLRNRPVGYGSAPVGYIVWSDRRDPRFAHGTIDYPRELEPAEIEGYELVPLGQVTL